MLLVVVDGGGGGGEVALLHVLLARGQHLAYYGWKNRLFEQTLKTEQCLISPAAQKTHFPALILATSAPAWWSLAAR